MKDTSGSYELWESVVAFLYTVGLSVTKLVVLEMLLKVC